MENDTFGGFEFGLNIMADYARAPFFVRKILADFSLKLGFAETDS